MPKLVRYIHRNPLRAGMIKKIDQYKLSSDPGYLSISKKWDWIYKDFILAMLATSIRNRIKLYREFINQEGSEELTYFFGKKKLPSVLGKAEIFYMKGKIEGCAS